MMDCEGAIPKPSRVGAGRSRGIRGIRGLFGMVCGKDAENGEKGRSLRRCFHRYGDSICNSFQTLQTSAQPLSTGGAIVAISFGSEPQLAGVFPFRQVGKMVIYR